MPKKPNLPKELTKNKKKELLPITYSSFEECKNEYIDEIKELYNKTNFEDIKSNRSLWIENNVIKTLPYFAQRHSHNIGYSAEDLDNTLDVLLEICRIYNKTTRYQPTIYTFCRLLGISSGTFTQWKYENNERGEKSREVEDFFKSRLSQGMITGEIHPAAGAFIGKATLGMKEADGQQMNINIIGADLSFEEIMAEYEKNKK